LFSVFGRNIVHSWFLDINDSVDARDARVQCIPAISGVSVLLPAPQAALQWRMPELTRRRSSDAREECWHVNYGDVHAGTIAIRSDNSIDITD
jgi:hypothetical protein